MLSDKIKSIRETLNREYVKPSPERVQELIDTLAASEEAKSYLRTRGLSSETIAHFKLGYDFLRNAISIPVFKNGECINIRYRLIHPKAGESKYVQEKGCEIWIYNEEGIQEGLKKGKILLVEGEFDLMMVWQAGNKAVISAASGKDSYAPWIEQLDPIAKVYIAYDNDKGGRETSVKIAERIGTEKSFEVLYPYDVKDANEFFLKYDIEKFKEIVSNARPFYTHKFKGVGDIINELRQDKSDRLKVDCIPFIEFEKDWIAIISGDSNIGKTTYVMNVANELTQKNIPTLVLPFERGTASVGKRFLQVKFDMTNQDFAVASNEKWENLIEESIDLPLFFAMPKNEEIRDTIARAKRIFNIQFVIVDHLDYLVRKSDNNKNEETAKTLQEFKSLAQEHNIIFLIVHHIKKPEGRAERPRAPKKEDLKGSSSIYQDPEAVIMLHRTAFDDLEVHIVKNKGEMGMKTYKFNLNTGRISELYEKKEKVEVKKELLVETEETKQLSILKGNP